MKYSHMLLITLVISLMWGLVLFILGCFFRFQQASLVSRFVENLRETANLQACIPPDNPNLNLCPVETSFDTVELGSWANFLGAMTLVTGLLIVLLSACGFVGVLKKSQGVLLVMLVLIIVAIALEYYLLDVLLDGSSDFHADAQDEMVELLNEKYFIVPEKVNSFTKMMNALMITAECCGIKGKSDFDFNVTFPMSTRAGSNKFVVKVPPACCSNEIFDDAASRNLWSNVMTCTRDDWAIKASTDGCYGKIHGDLYNSYGGALVGFLMFLILWEGVQGILLFMIILRPSAKPHKRSMASSGSSRRSGGSMVKSQSPKKFIAFSKTSSHLSNDINRIKSTEIW